MNQTYRIKPACLALIILIVMGLIYAWSVISVPIEAEFPEWSKSEISLTFTLLMVFFCIGQLVCGYIVDSIRPKYAIITGACLILLGFYISSKADTLVDLYFGFGFLCGFGAGIAYNSVMSTMLKWYWDRPGYISGILLMGFGIGGFLIGKLYQLWTPTEVGGWRISFVVMGIAIFIVLILAAVKFEKPYEELSLNSKCENNTIDYKPEDTIKSPVFWLYYLWAIVCNAAGLSIISQGTGIVIEVVKEIDAASIATLVGIISIFNALGRVAFGTIYDKCGRSISMQLVGSMFIATAIILFVAFKTHSLVLLIITFVLCGLSYSGIPPTNSAFSREYFGAKHYGVNFSLVNSNMIIASFGSVLAGAVFDYTGSYNSIVLLIIVFAVIGMLCSMAISHLESKEKYFKKIK